MAKKNIRDWLTDEKSLAKIVVQYLEQSGFDVYCEVPTVNGYCDIIAVKENYICSFETKMQFSFEVLEQAELNNKISNYSFVAVPYPKKGNISFKRKIAKMLKVGVLVVDENKGCIILDDAPLNENIKRPPKLKEWQKLNEAGGQTRLTPFKVLVNDVTLYLKNNPNGASYHELWDKLDVHYSSVSSFRSAFNKLIERGVIKNIKIIKGILYYDENSRKL